MVLQIYMRQSLKTLKVLLSQNEPLSMNLRNAPLRPLRVAK